MLQVNNKKYIAKCYICSESIKFKINYEDFSVSVECKRGHKINHIPFKIFQNKFIIRSNTTKKKCSNCFKEINDMSVNYKCQECNKLICSDCFNKHKILTSHKSKIEFIQKNQLCPIHNKKYSLYCQKCKINLCSKCQSSHENHDLMSYLEVIPNKQKKDLAQRKYETFHLKINNLKEKLEIYKNKIIDEYLFNIHFLDFLDDISQHLINNIDINCFDYYNYENFQYLLNIFDDKKILDSSHYKNKIINCPPLTKIKCSKSSYQKIIFNVNNSNIIHDIDRIEHLKDNFFYLFENKFLKIFEYKDFSFNIVSNYNLTNYKVKSIKPAKYTNEILFNSRVNGKIKFLKYDLKNKFLKISRKEIKYITFPDYNPINNIEYFDNANGNIITFYRYKIKVWKKDPKKHSYNETLTIYGAQDSLNVINENLFCFQDANYNILFYDCNIYKCMKIINCTEKIIKFIGFVNDEIILFSIGYKLNLINIKYLEIVQILDHWEHFYDNYVLNKNDLLFIHKNYNKIQIVINRFSENEKCFLEYKTYDADIDIGYINKALMGNDNTLVLCNYSNITFIDINMLN